MTASRERRSVGQACVLLGKGTLVLWGKAGNSSLPYFIVIYRGLANGLSVVTGKPYKGRNRIQSPGREAVAKVVHGRSEFCIGEMDQLELGRRGRQHAE